jgi:cytochrome c553
MRTRLTLTLSVLLFVGLVACGDDAPAPKPSNGGGQAAGTAPGDGTGKPDAGTADPDKTDPTDPDKTDSGAAKTDETGGAAGKAPAGDQKFTAKDKRTAKTHFSTYCATCHGLDGKGKGPAALAMNPKPRNWTDPEWQKTVDDDRLFKVIKEGGATVGLSPLMAANPMSGDQPAVIWALVDMVRSFQGK